jgi:hypothetical protein
LKDATVEITSLGEPTFIPGQTPPVKARPYVRFTGLPVNNPDTSFGLQNPVRASSEAPGHSSWLANDGNVATFWQAVGDDTNAWLRVDLERIVTVSKIRLTFPTEGNWRYQIEVSDDGSSNWRLVADHTKTISVEKVRNDNAQSGVRGRFLRVKFTSLPAGQPAALSEVEALGTLE